MKKPDSMKEWSKRLEDYLKGPGEEHPTICLDNFPPFPQYGHAYVGPTEEYNSLHPEIRARYVSEGRFGTTFARKKEPIDY